MAKTQEDDRVLNTEFDGRLQFYQYYYKVKENALVARRLGLLDVWRDEMHDLADHVSPYMSKKNREVLYEGGNDMVGLWQVQEWIAVLEYGGERGDVLLENIRRRRVRRIKRALYVIQQWLTESVKHMLLPVGKGDDDDEWDEVEFRRRSGLA